MSPRWGSVPVWLTGPHGKMGVEEVSGILPWKQTHPAPPTLVLQDQEVEKEKGLEEEVVVEEEVAEEEEGCRLSRRIAIFQPS